MRARKKKKGPCAIDGCWQDALCAGFCSACYSGINRLFLLHVSDIAFRLKKYQRLEARITSFAGVRKRKKA